MFLAQGAVFMSFSSKWSWKVASGIGAVGIAATIFGGAASANPLSPIAPKPAPAPIVSVPKTSLIGSNGAAKGALVPASPSVSAYWTKLSRVARTLTSPAPPPQTRRFTKIRTRAVPQGKSVAVPGKVGALRIPKTLATPALGSTGTPWWGNYWSAPATTTGKVFFTDHRGGNWVCSGSLVNSPAQNVVITAGHCVYGTAGGELPAGETWHSNWVFAPDYSNGYAPFGYWTARQLWTLTNYANNGDEQDDLGAAILNRNSSGWNAVSLLGGQGFAWNQNSSQYVYDFGYPAASPFNGQTLQECNGSSGWNGWWWVDMEMLNCNFTGGSSGGPWLIGFNGQWGYINSVNDANGYFLFGGQMGGLYFGNNAGALYNAVANV
jgi:V8-like Glu-specific endopeptidase